MKKAVVIISLLLGFSYIGFSQEALLDEQVAPIYANSKWGPNQSNFIHLYCGFGFVTPMGQNDANPVYLGKSSNWELGLRYKKRITNWLAIGGNVSYDLFNYRIPQNSDKKFPDLLFYSKQKVLIHNISLQPFLRFNFGRRGNKIGNYIDVGAFYNFVVGSAEKQFNTPNGLDKVKKKNLSYISKSYYGLFTNIGFGRLSIYGKYNMSSIFNDSKYADMPPLTIGLQLGFF